MRRAWVVAALLLPGLCSGGERKLSDDTGVEAVHKTFELGDGDWSSFDSAIDRWERKHPRAELSDVLATLPRQAKEKCWEGSGADSRAHSTFSFCWNDVPDSSKDDEDNKYWYPQGIASSAESRWSKLSGRKVLAVTWYKRRDKDSSKPSVGSRVSIVDVGDPGRVLYRHVNLVEPVCKDCDSWRVLAIHAGGAAWSGRYLYVVDTAQGLRVFDLRRFLKSGNSFVLPQVAFYKEAGATQLDFSYASIEAGGSTLVTGEYKDGKDGARIVHWPLAKDGKLALSSGRVRSTKALVTRGELKNLQGVAVRSGKYYFTRSHSTREGELIVGEPGERFHSYDDWSKGPEDLSVEPGGLIWGLTEHPGEGRSVYSSKF